MLHNHLLYKEPMGRLGGPHRLDGLITAVLQDSAAATAQHEVTPRPLAWVVDARDYSPRPRRNEMRHRTLASLDSISRQSYGGISTANVIVLEDMGNEGRAGETLFDTDRYTLSIGADDCLPIEVRQIPVQKELSTLQALGDAAAHLLHVPEPELWNQEGEAPEIIMCLRAGARYLTDQAARAAVHWISNGARCVYGAGVPGCHTPFLESWRAVANALKCAPMRPRDVLYATYNAGYEAEFLAKAGTLPLPTTPARTVAELWGDSPATPQAVVSELALSTQMTAVDMLRYEI